MTGFLVRNVGKRLLDFVEINVRHVLHILITYTTCAQQAQLIDKMVAYKKGLTFSNAI